MKYNITFYGEEKTQVVSVLPSKAKQILDSLKTSRNKREDWVTLDHSHSCTLAQITNVSRDYDSEPLVDSRKLLAALEVEALTEEKLREGWHRALCIAISHGLPRDSGVIARYCHTYQIDPEALYPMPCTVCQSA
jgi:hypothetical protein